jgi:hypothetical protein
MWLIHQEDTKIINTHVLNIRTPKYIKQLLKDQIDYNTTIEGDPNISLPTMSRSEESKKKHGIWPTLQTKWTLQHL